MTSTTYVTRINHGERTLLVGAATRALVERALRAAGFEITYPVLTREAIENYDGPGATAALTYPGTVYALNHLSGTVAAVRPVQDVMDEVYALAARALSALDTGDLDAVRVRLLEMAGGVEVDTTTSVEVDEPQPEPDPEPESVSDRVLAALRAAEGLTVKEVAERADVTAAAARSAIKALGARVAQDGNNAKGVKVYVAA